MTETDPVHEEMGTDAQVDEASHRQRMLTAALLAQSGVDTVDDMVRPEADQ